jgi:hypothetical protein
MASDYLGVGARRAANLKAIRHAANFGRPEAPAMPQRYS